MTFTSKTPATYHDYMGGGYSVTVQYCDYRNADGYYCNEYLGANYPSANCGNHPKVSLVKPNRFDVIRSVPVYHHSTDGYIGQRTYIEATFTTMADAWSYVESYWENNPEDNETGLSLRINGRNYVWCDLVIVYSGYAGPVVWSDHEWSDIPF